MVFKDNRKIRIHKDVVRDRFLQFCDQLGNDALNEANQVDSVRGHQRFVNALLQYLAVEVKSEKVVYRKGQIFGASLKQLPTTTSDRFKTINKESVYLTPIPTSRQTPMVTVQDLENKARRLTHEFKIESNVADPLGSGTFGAVFRGKVLECAEGKKSLIIPNIAKKYTTYAVVGI